MFGVSETMIFLSPKLKYISRFYENLEAQWDVKIFLSEFFTHSYFAEYF